MRTSSTMPMIVRYSLRPEWVVFCRSAPGQRTRIPDLRFKAGTGREPPVCSRGRNAANWTLTAGRCFGSCRPQSGPLECPRAGDPQAGIGLGPTTGPGGRVTARAPLGLE